MSWYYNIRVKFKGHLQNSLLILEWFVALSLGLTKQYSGNEFINCLQRTTFFFTFCHIGFYGGVHETHDIHNLYMSFVLHTQNFRVMTYITEHFCKCFTCAQNVLPVYNNTIPGLHKLVTFDNLWEHILQRPHMYISSILVQTWVCLREFCIVGCCYWCDGIVVSVNGLFVVDG